MVALLPQGPRRPFSMRSTFQWWRPRLWCGVFDTDLSGHDAAMSWAEVCATGCTCELTLSLSVCPIIIMFLLLLPMLIMLLFLLFCIHPRIYLLIILCALLHADQSPRGGQQQPEQQQQQQQHFSMRSTFQWWSPRLWCGVFGTDLLGHDAAMSWVEVCATGCTCELTLSLSVCTIITCL